MTEIVLRGGLGNQLFQYAAARALSLRSGTETRIITTLLNSDFGEDVSERDLHLHNFDIKAETYGSSALSRAQRLYYRAERKTGAVLGRLAADVLGVYTEQERFGCDPNFGTIPGNLRLYGYWQSERYFRDHSDLIRAELTLSSDMNDENRRWHDRITDARSLSVHVRRGDYINLGLDLPPEYYRAALTQVSDRGISDVFFFSDDIGWVRENADRLVPERMDVAAHFVDCNSEVGPHEDLRLMRACDHHVIANSTFSWWGAWLDESDEALTVSPAYWFDVPTDEIRVIPQRWKTVDW